MYGPSKYIYRRSCIFYRRFTGFQRSLLTFRPFSRNLSALLLFFGRIKFFIGVFPDFGGPCSLFGFPRNLSALLLFFSSSHKTFYGRFTGFRRSLLTFQLSSKFIQRFSSFFEHKRFFIGVSQDFSGLPNFLLFSKFISASPLFFRRIIFFIGVSQDFGGPCSLFSFSRNLSALLLFFSAQYFLSAFHRISAVLHGK